MAKKHIYILAFITLFGFGAMGLFTLNWVSDVLPIEIIDLHTPVYLQLFFGVATGFISAYIALYLIESKLIRPSSKKYIDLIQGLNLNRMEIVILSFCAGFGEEILFRACMQHYFGIWITAIVFVAIHGYLSPKDWRIFIYGFIMIGIIAAFGYLYDEYKIIPPAIAHFIFDVILLWRLSKKEISENYEEQ